MSTCSPRPASRPLSGGSSLGRRNNGRRKARWACAVAMSVLLVTVGCGSGGGSANRAQTKTQSSTGGSSTVASIPTSPSTSTTTRPSATYYSGPISFTTSDGWRYTYTPDISPISLSLSKDVQTSPPGSARLRVSGASSIPASFPGVVAGDTPGRTPPPLHSAFYFSSAEPYLIAEWPVNAGAAANLLPNQLLYKLPSTCTFESNGTTLVAPTVFMCKVVVGARAEDPLLSSDVSEAYVDSVLQVVPILSAPYLRVEVYTESGQSVQTIVLAPDGSYKSNP